MSLKRREGITSTDREIENSQFKDRNLVRAALLGLHAGYVDGGHPEHIITNAEAQQVLGLNETQFERLLFSGFTDNSLKAVLKRLGLPYEKENKVVESFTKKGIEDWFINYYKKTGVLPNKSTHDEACMAGELPNAANFKIIMRSDVRAYLRQFKAWVETRKITR